MKRLLTLLLAIFMVLPMVGCGKKEEATEKKEKAAAGQTTSEDTVIEKPEQYDSETLVFKGGSRNFGDNFGEFACDYQYVLGKDGKYYSVDNPVDTGIYDESAKEHFYLSGVLCRKYADGHINYNGYSISDIKGKPFFAHNVSSMATQLLEVLSFDGKKVYINRSQAGGLKMNTHDNVVLTFLDPSSGKVYDTVDNIVASFANKTLLVEVGGKNYYVEYRTPQYNNGYQVTLQNDINTANILSFGNSSGFTYFKAKTDNMVFVKNFEDNRETKLPEGYTVADIKYIVQTANYLGFWFNDNTIAQASIGNVAAVNEELTQYAKAGYVKEIVNAGGNLAVLMDDNGLYTITAQ